MHIKKNQPNKSSVAFHALQNLHLNLEDYHMEPIKPIQDNYKLDIEYVYTNTKVEPIS